jgi:DNA repair ATPase RecN/histidinol phosphatase-like PHP family hydrolase
METIQRLNQGADFVRSDLHIHSYGFDDGSFDVKDSSMTPENIVDTAISNSLSIISITDHNEINNVKKALDYSVGKNILVIPGIEVSTTQGHLLVYFSSFSELRKFHGNLSITEDKERCSQGIVECLDLAKTLGGIGVLAHIELDSGFEKMIGRFSKVMEDIYTHPNLYGLEISKKSSAKRYTQEDDNNERKKLVNLRKEKFGLSERSILPKLMSSDSHTINKLGTNADGDKRLTRVKVDQLSFQAFKNALLIHESRIRLEDFIPVSIPYISGLKIQGGLLDDQEIRFSKNLTCIIGGRGTGKSTLLESLKVSSGNKSTAKVVDSDVWPDEIELFYEDETGKQYVFKREKNYTSFNATDGDPGIDVIPIESYGQGETAETIQHSDENPKILLDFLDDFINISSLKTEDNRFRQEILDNQSDLARARTDVASIPEVNRKMLSLEEKKKRLEKDKVGDLVKYQSSLIAERSIRENLISELKDLIDKYKDILGEGETFEYFSSMSDESIVIGKDEFVKVKLIIDEFAGIVLSKSKELSDSLDKKIEELRAQLKLWKNKEVEIQKTIDEKKAELEAQGIPFDIGKINQIARDLEHYRGRLRKLTEVEKNRIKLETSRVELIKDRKNLKSAIYKERYAFAIKINENLKSSVDGFLVSAKYEEGCYSPSFESSIKQTMDWRTSQVAKAKLISESMSPVNFSECVKKGNLSELLNIKDEDGKSLFSNVDIKNIIDRFQHENNFEDLESLEYEDKPSLKVTKVHEDSQGNTIRVTRSIAQLSLGQQQSILLAILIQSKSTNPLLIDQPEDNLDSEFIYKTIVTNLRKIKEKRQVIIVTHNPNIAVLGDAELIIPLKSTSTKTKIVDRGSIDCENIRSLCCDILEGGKDAFLSRQELYGLSK